MQLFLFVEAGDDEGNLVEESLPDDLRNCNENPVLRNVMMNTTVKASMKFKSKRKGSFNKKSPKSSFKGKSPKSSFKGKVRTMSISRSFLDENIKNAGKADMHRRKSVLNSNETAVNRETSPQDNESSVSSNDQENKLSIVEKQERKEATGMLYEKEKKDLQRAHSVLVDEYRRRREIRCKIMNKFGRASAKLKMVLAQTKG